MLRALILTLALLILPARDAAAYSVLAHEAIIDATWDGTIAPLLRARFGASQQTLREARAYAYGGCILQDLGYYPFSSRTFGDLAHYVRSGDFVVSLLREAHNANEYAFALGALAHYAADTTGHSLAVNPSVPLLFPKVGERVGRIATYEDDPTAHLRTEFAFDVIQVARGRYVSEAYHDFIGFEVSKPVLDRALRATYGLGVDDLFGDFGLAVNTFRWAVASLVPDLTLTAWASRQEEIQRLVPTATAERFVFAMSRQDFERRWGRAYARPNAVERLLAFVLHLVPKIGPVKKLAFKMPTPQSDRLFLSSFDHVVADYRTLVPRTAAREFALPNRNFDTGDAVRLGDYRLADNTYWALLTRQRDANFVGMSPALRASLLAFYGDGAAPGTTDAKTAGKLADMLRRLR